MARRQLKLYGKKATSDDILLEISNLLYAKGYRPFPLKPVEIAKTLGLSRKTVYNYITKLSKTNYNYGIIAEVGGWHTIDEIKKSYGQIPPEKILEIIE